MPQEISASVSALFPPQRPPSVLGRLGREKRKRGEVARLLFFDYGYQAEASADERGECDKRGAEMNWNKRRTLFVQVRIDLEARLIITLLFKCEVEISWCYRSNETSSVKLLYSTTDFLQFTKKKLNIISTWIFRPLLGLLEVTGLKF